MYSGPVHIQVNGGSRDDNRLPFLINRGRVLLGPMVQHSEARGSLGVQKDRYMLDDGSYVDAIRTPYVKIINVYMVPPGGGGEEPGKKPRYIYPVSFCSSDDESIIQANVPWWHYRPAYGPVDVVTGDRAVSWASNKTGKLADYPCGNMTWFPAIPAEVPESAEPLAAISWMGPKQRTFVHLQEEQVVPESDTFVWLSFYDKNVPIVKMQTPVQVHGAYLHTETDGFIETKVVSILTFEGNANSVSLVRRRYVEGAWEQVWSTPLDTRVITHKTHVMVNPAGTEARFLCLEQRPDGDRIIDGDLVAWDTSFVLAHIEVVVDLTNGSVSLDWEDIAEEYPYHVSYVEDDFLDSILPDANKQYVLETEIDPGVTTTATIKYNGRTGYDGTERKQMPYVGEKYEYGDQSDLYIIEITNVTIVDPIPPGTQEMVDQDDIELLSEEDQEQVVTSEAGPPFRGDFHGRGADIEFTYTKLPATDPPHITNIGSVLSLINQEGVCKYRWRRIVRKYSVGRVICAVDYDSQGTVVKAFLRVREKMSRFFEDSCGVGLAIVPPLYQTTLPKFPDETGDTAENDPLDDAASPTGRVHTYQRAMAKHVQTRAYVDIEGGVHTGKSFEVLNLGFRSNFSAQGDGYEPVVVDGVWGEVRYGYYTPDFTTWVAPQVTYQYYPGPEGGTQNNSTSNTYDVLDPTHDGIKGTVYVAHLDLRDASLLLDYTGSNAYAERNENDQVIGDIATREPENIGGAIPRDEAGEIVYPSFNGFNAITIGNRFDGVQQTQVRTGLVRRHTLFHPPAEGAVGIPVVSAHVDNNGSQVEAFALFGFQGFYSPTSGHTQSCTVGMSCHSSQVAPDADITGVKGKTVREYGAMPQHNGIIYSGNGVYGTSAGDYLGARVCHMRGEWMNDTWTPVGEQNMTTSTQLLHRDDWEMIYRYDVEQVRSKAEQWDDVYGTPEPADPLRRGADVWYGSKPQIKVD